MKKPFFYAGLVLPIIGMALSGAASILNRGNYNSLQHPTSNLVHLQYGWLQTAAPGVSGIGFALLGLVIFSNIKHRTKAPLLVVLFGLLFSLETIFHSDWDQNHPTTLHGRLHIMLFGIGIMALMVGVMWFGLAMRKFNSTLAWYSLLTVLVSVVGFIGVFTLNNATGIMQQFTFVPLVLWVEALAIYTHLKKRAL